MHRAFYLQRIHVEEKKENGRTNPRRGNATISNFNTLIGFMLVAILWSRYSGYLTTFALTIDTHYQALAQFKPNIKVRLYSGQ